MIQVQQYKDIETTPSVQRQSQLLNSLLIAIFVVGFLIYLLYEITRPVKTFELNYYLILKIFSFLVLLIPYRLNRHGYYRTASFVTLFIYSFGIFLLAIPWNFKPNNIDLFLYLIIPIIAGSALLSFRSAIVYTGANLFILLLIAFIMRHYSFVRDLVAYFGFLGAVATLLFTVLYHRNRLEQDRQIELLKKEEKFRIIFQESPDGILVFDFSGKVINVNAAALQILGHTKREVIGSYHGQLFPYLRQDANFGWHKNVKGRKGEVGIKEVYRPDGKTVYLDIKTTQIPWDNENVAVMIFRDVSEIVRAEKKLKSSLQEKQVLLTEIHHRVKNNLQTVISLLNLQSLRIKDKKALQSFEDSVNRIHTMALVHEKLYRSEDLSRIDFKDYVETMVKELFEVNKTNKNVGLKMDVHSVMLSIDLAIPCGLIVNELVTNALKHAFPKNQKGTIRLSLRLLPDHTHELIVQDNGVGFPANMDLSTNGSLGLQLVKGLTSQLHGHFKMERDKGSIFTVTFQN
jgi:PAS domain S-box-containing protein